MEKIHEIYVEWCKKNFHYIQQLPSIKSEKKFFENLFDLIYQTGYDSAKEFYHDIGDGDPDY